MTPDPLGGDISNPQSLNRYAYVLNSPVTLTDPSGLDSCTIGSDCVTVSDTFPDPIDAVLAEFYLSQLLPGNTFQYVGPPGFKLKAVTPPKPQNQLITWPQLQTLVRENNESNSCDDVIDCIVFKESTVPGGFNANAVPPINSKTGAPQSSARGLMQVTRPATVDLHRLYPANFPANTYDQLFNPVTNIQAGSTYLDVLVGRFGSLSTALAHYGTGQGYPNDVLNCVKQLQNGNFSAAEAAAHGH